MTCQCETLEHLEGADAVAYARDHLIWIAVDEAAWEAEYRCPDTGLRWRMTYPGSHLQGGGPPLLARLPW